MTSITKSSSYFVYRDGKAMTQVRLNDMELSLLASGDGTEVIRHKLNAGVYWHLRPEDGWDALEYCFILRGSLRQETEDGDAVFRAGDSFGAHPVQNYAIFRAETDTEFLYVSSKPIFHLYCSALREVEDLAVSIEVKDGYTADHCNRIMELSMKVARVMQLPSEQQLHTQLGAFLHDVGKVKVSDSILNKAGPLSASEWELMKHHPAFGRDMLLETGLPYLIGASEVVLQHHERFDGSGYPYGLTGDEIHIGAAIIAVVDSYDAMTTDRVYRKAKPKEAALLEIEQLKGTMYHPDVVDAFLKIVG